MREILFRGKKISDGKWLYGYYSDEKSVDADFPCIEPLQNCPCDDSYVDDTWEVDEKTVGQFTGLHDGNGNKIFEGDIVTPHKFSGGIGVVKTGIYHDEVNGPHMGFYIDWGAKSRLKQSLAFWFAEIQIIGNAYDNTELLETKK